MQSLPAPPAFPPRHDIYGPIHKGLRRAHAELMGRLGWADYAVDQSALLADLREHLRLGAKHLAHEEAHIHTALEARAPQGAARLDAQHAHHRMRFLEVEHHIRGVEAGGGPAAGRALYLEFGQLVAEDLAHMHEEETITWPRLCALFSDHELIEMEMTIVGSLSPEDTIAFMRMMIPAMNPAERAGLLGGMKAGAPPEAFAAVFEHAVRATLGANDIEDLERLGLAA